MIPVTKEAYRLFHDGAIVFAQIEADGMRVDTDYLKRMILQVGRKIDGLQARLKQDEVYKVWRKRFGSKTNLGSRTQLGSILFGELGYTVGSVTKTGRAQVNETELEKIDLPFVRRLLKIEKLKKALNTYLRGIQREVEGEYLHPSFNLHTVQTYRSSCQDPNFQNIPIRDPKIGKLIRRCFIPRDRHCMVEIDYDKAEVRVAACCCQDPSLMAYVTDPTKDMHRDMAAECFLCETEDVSKAMRYCGKNQFVFPEFYGSFWLNCAPNLWDSMEKMKLEIRGTSLRDWLAVKGITRLGKKESSYNTGRITTEEGTYLEHIRQVESDFWGKRFSVYDQWREDWYQAYCKTGGFQVCTGFRVDGVFNRRQVINSPVQGPAFHCLLWSLIRLQRWLRKNRMRSKIVGQIHDSIVIDTHMGELQDVLAMAKEIMTERIRKVWDWIIVPLEVDAEVAPAGASWFEKEKVKI